MFSDEVTRRFQRFRDRVNTSKLSFSLANIELTDQDEPEKLLRHLVQEFPEVDELSLGSMSSNGQQYDGCGLGQLEGLRNLKILDLSFNAIGETHAAEIGKLIHLEKLNLSCNETFGDTCAVAIEPLRNLVELDLERTMFGSAGLEAVEGLVKIQKMNLQITQVDDKGLKHLAALSELRELLLSYNSLDGSGLEFLQELPIVKLLLRDTQIEDAYVGLLRQLKELQNLDLRKTKVTKAGVLQLASMDSLKTLRMHPVNLSKDWATINRGVAEEVFALLQSEDFPPAD